MCRIFVIVFLSVISLGCNAQELYAKVNINHQQIQGTDNSVFDALKTNLEQFINDHQWTELQFKKNERINCSFSLTVQAYDKSTNIFTCQATIQGNRPVYNSSYTSTFYNNVDKSFCFKFAQFDQLEYNEEAPENNSLTALVAYYAYLLIGMDLDTFAPKGGEDILQKCMYLVNNCQNTEFAGWKSFDDSRNRFAIINDYLDGGMEPLRLLQYDYYRKGLDEMANNVERGRTEISTALAQLKTAHENKPLSFIPQIWTDFKKDELANIYKGKGTVKEKQAVYDILFGINASQNATWEKIKQ